MLAIGIDPGLHGAIAFVDAREARVFLMPLRGDTERDEYDVDRLRAAIGAVALRADVIVYEKLHPMPGSFKREGGVEQRSGTIANYNRGAARWFITGLLCGLGVPPERRVAVPAQTWQRAMLENIPGADTKAKSIWLAQRIFPSVSLLATARSRKPHDGMADALCLAEYGRRLLAGDKGRQRGLLEVSA